MTASHRRALRAAVLSALLLPGFAARADDMSAAAALFYNTYLALPREGVIPGAAARARYAPLLSPRLNALLAQAAAADARFRARNKDAPPLFEGDLFSSLFEGFGSFRLGACAGDANSGHCAVTLHHQDPGTPPARGAKGHNNEPVEWNDEVRLVRTPSGWKVDDIAYMAGFAFGNDGLLSQTLRMVISTQP